MIRVSLTRDIGILLPGAPHPAFREPATPIFAAGLRRPVLGWLRGGDKRTRVRPAPPGASVKRQYHRDTRSIIHGRGGAMPPDGCCPANAWRTSWALTSSAGSEGVSDEPRDIAACRVRDP